MVTMLAIMKDTDDHYADVAEKLDIIRRQVDGKPVLTVIKSVDTIQ